MRNFGSSVPALAAAAALSALAAPAQSAVILNVGWNSDLCGKGTCFNDDGVFKQTWSASDAPRGLQTIARFLMARGVLGALDGQTFKISFNVGDKELGSWGSYNMGGVGGDELNFDGLDFDWNPDDGDLVLTLAIKQAPKGGAGGFGGGGGGGVGGLALAAETSGGDGMPGLGDLPGGSDMVVDGSTGSDVDMGPLGSLGGVGGVLPAGPHAGASGAPEPVSWAMMILGLGVAGASLRQRRRVVSRTRAT